MRVWGGGIKVVMVGQGVGKGGSRAFLSQLCSTYPKYSKSYAYACFYVASMKNPSCW